MKINPAERQRKREQQEEIERQVKAKVDRREQVAKH